MHLDPVSLALLVFLLSAAISFLVAALIKGTFMAIQALNRPAPKPLPEGSTANPQLNP